MVSRGWFDQAELAAAMGLTDGRHVMLAQSLAHPLAVAVPPRYSRVLGRLGRACGT